jgi:predicted amino acid racemase
LFLAALTARNPALIDAAVELHQAGAIPPGTFVVDADAVERNAAQLAAAARSVGVRLYFMTKQIGRNPVICRRVLAHIPAAVAVDMDDADALASAAVPLGHVGHLVQPSTASIERMLGHDPEVVTVFSVAKARQISRVARELGREQALLIRVVDAGDELFPGQEGGIPLDGLASARAAIDALPGVRVAGVTTYPAVRFNGSTYEPTANLRTIQRAARLLGDLEQINAAGHTSVDVLPLIAEAGATHAEPGHALTGSTPRAAGGRTPETPAVCFVSEVSHLDDDHVSVFGGGFYARGNAHGGLVVHGSARHRLDLVPLPHDAIDYYRRLVRGADAVSVGDSVVFAFRFQAFTSRARVATVEDVAAGRPRLVGLHDVYGRPVAPPVADQVSGAGRS